MRRLVFVLLLLALCAGLAAQKSPIVNGLNEARFIWRAAEDSLNTYFEDSFSFSLAYNYFTFGLKFNAGLPRYSTDQNQLLDELRPDALGWDWEDLYASYARDAWLIHAGKMEETFGSGMIFRSYENVELDEDYRVTGFKFGYDRGLRLKALYSGYSGGSGGGKLDLAYGMDAEYPVLQPLTLGATAFSAQSYVGTKYLQDNVLGGRAKLRKGPLEAGVEYASRDKVDNPDNGSAVYADASLSLSLLQFGAAYKYYDNFNYYNNFQDIPLANHHSETLSDGQASGSDEQGFQVWTIFSLPRDLTLNLDYAEAWDSSKKLRMNDFYAGLDWMKGKLNGTLSFSYLEKLDESDTELLDGNKNRWQKEYYPGFVVSFPAWGYQPTLTGEFKAVAKESVTQSEQNGVSYDQLYESSHYEPKLQLDVALGKLSLALGAQAWWEDFSSITDGTYWPNLEAKYPILSGTDLVVFVGREAGGKVCRNGVCRYMAPFSGLRVDLNTRF